MSESRRGKAMRVLLKVLGFVDSLNERLGFGMALLLYAIFIVMLIEVISRYVFNAPAHWTFMLTLFIFSYATFLGAGWVLLHKGHVNVDILHSRLSPRWQAIVDLITAPFMFIFIVTLLWQGAKVFWDSFSFLEREVVTTWHAPLYPIKLVIPIGAAFILLQALAKFIRDIIAATKGRIV